MLHSMVSRIKCTDRAILVQDVHEFWDTGHTGYGFVWSLVKEVKQVVGGK